MLRSRIAPLVALLALLVFALAALSSSVFAQSPEQVLYAFYAYTTDCSKPTAPVVADGAGNLYGTTLGGGVNKYGCVFELSSSDSGGWNETVLYNFSGGLDGGSPWAGLIFDKAGNLYGTTEGGGPYGVGVAFELSPSSNGGWTETVLHSFGNGTDGAGPQSNLIFDKGGNLYGTTLGSVGTRRGGSVFKLSPGQSGWTETVLYTFPTSALGPDGNGPAGGVVMDRKGNLYGATGFGGEDGYGAVYELALLKDGSYKESVINSFDLSDGWEPQSGLTIDRSGTLYGTTVGGGGGPCFCGLVFRLKKNSAGIWTENVLHQMTGNDGASTQGPVVFDSLGNLFAVGQFGGGGSNTFGSVFELTPTPSGPWKETVLHIFDLLSNPNDGADPYAGVIVGPGQLFGTTNAGGPLFEGTVFEITLPAPVEP
jgi:uncharacterized repeat protein (TIGR03803 family)